MGAGYSVTTVVQLLGRVQGHGQGHAKNFTAWCDKNKEHIEHMRERGTLPYFIKDNKGRYANKIWKVKMEVYKDGKERFYSITK